MRAVVVVADIGQRLRLAVVAQVAVVQAGQLQVLTELSEQQVQ